MGRASVRAAIVAYLTPASITGLSTVYRSRPKLIPAQAYNLSVNSGSGAVMIVHMPRDKEDRYALGGATSGHKWDKHQVALELLFQSVKVDAMAAQDDHDALIDALMARIRSDRTFGTAGTPIFQVGEDSTGIDIDLAEPVLADQVVKIDAVIKFEAWEDVTPA